MIDDVGKGYREEPELDVANYLTNGRMGTEQSVECRVQELRCRAESVSAYQHLLSW